MRRDDGEAEMKEPWWARQAGNQSGKVANGLLSERLRGSLIGEWRGECQRWTRTTFDSTRVCVCRRGYVHAWCPLVALSCKTRQQITKYDNKNKRRKTKTKHNSSFFLLSWNFPIAVVILFLFIHLLLPLCFFDLRWWSVIVFICCSADLICIFSWFFSLFLLFLLLFF